MSCCKGLLFTGRLLLELLDMIFDWLVWADVKTAEDGLVYGRPESAVINALLFFSIVGTITFIVEITNLFREVCRGKPWVNGDYVSCVTIWIEDVPQIVINLYIVICREEAISIFQLIKASVAILELVVRIICSLVKCCRRCRNGHKGDSSRCLKVVSVLIMVGLILNAACALAIFVFTNTQREKNGDLTYLPPDSLFEDKLNEQRYLQNVSIFVRHPDMDQNTTSTWESSQTHWMRLLSISDLKDRPELYHSYNYVYERQEDRMILAIYNQTSAQGGGRMGQWTLRECYSTDLTWRHVAPQNDTVCQTFGAAAVSYYITFSFTPPSSTFPRRLIFGDVRVNMKTLAAGQCIDTTTPSADNAGPLLQYFRVGAHLPLSQQKHLLQQTQGQPRFYRSDGTDLEDVSQMWKTGWWQCDSSGSKAPHLDPSIATDCSNSPNSVNG